MDLREKKVNTMYTKQTKYQKIRCKDTKTRERTLERA